MTRAPGCPICRGRLNENGTCPFVDSHVNILRMRAEQGSAHSRKLRGRPAVNRTSKDKLKEMSKKAAAKRRKKK